MPTSHADLLLQHVYKLAVPPRRLTDRDLLRRFAERRDETAFAELIERHGAMVQRTAERVLHNSHDADDVSQAAFLVLARKAGTLSWQPALGPWLYQVAYRLALQARGEALRRRSQERCHQPQPAGDPLADLTVREAQAVIDEELMRLPEPLRAPLVLCVLQGASRGEAARQLGLPLGTLARRLRQARTLLRARLARRGLGLSAALLALVLTPAAGPAAFSTALAQTMARAGVLAATGGQPVSLVSPRAASLAAALARAALWTRLKCAAVLVVLLGAVAAGLGVAAQGTPRESEAAPGGGQEAIPVVSKEASRDVQAQVPPKDQAKVEPRVTITPGPVIDCTTIGPTKDGGKAMYGWHVQLVGFSPDGKAVFTHTEYDGRLWSAATGQPLTPSIRMGFGPQAAGFRADGKVLVCWGHGCLQFLDAATGKPFFAPGQKYPELERSKTGSFFTSVSAAAVSPLEFFVVVGDQQAKMAKVISTGPRGHTLSESLGSGSVRAVAFDATGKKAACAILRDDAKVDVYVWWVMNGDQVVEPLQLQSDVYALAFSPDGKLLLTVRGGVQLTRAGEHCQGEIRAWDLQTGKQVGQPWDNTEALEQLAFRPDGKEVLAVVQGRAVTWDVATGKKRHVFAHPAPGKVKAAVWSRDGNWVVTAGETPATAKGRSGSLRVWDAATGQLLADPVEHPDSVSSLAAAPDGRSFITGCWDGKARLWRIEPVKKG
jgi:RNA polymerase sigma factor (sigma-70 family)